jgi:hypothetical protein
MLYAAKWLAPAPRIVASSRSLPAHFPSIAKALPNLLNLRLCKLYLVQLRCNTGVPLVAEVRGGYPLGVNVSSASDLAVLSSS